MENLLEVNQVTIFDMHAVWNKVIFHTRINLHYISSLSTNVQVPYFDVLHIRRPLADCKGMGPRKCSDKH